MPRNSFSYRQCVQNVIDGSPLAHSPAGMVRIAISNGAPDTGASLRKKLRDACESLANQSGYKRLKQKDTSGYMYQRI